MNSFIVKIDLTKLVSFRQIETLHNEIIKYYFITYIGKSKIDGLHIYKINSDHKLYERYYKINKLCKIINNEKHNDNFIDDKENQFNIITFINKYNDVLSIVPTLEDHLSNKLNNKIHRFA